MKIVFCAAEAAPFAKVGGLADVVGSLPKALTGLANEVIVCLPFYGCIDTDAYTLFETDMAFDVPHQDKVYGFRILETTLPGSSVKVYLFHNDALFRRNQAIYPPDQPEFEVHRLEVFSQGVFHLLRQLNWQPDVFHVHDWHTSPVVVYLNQHYRNDPLFSHSATVLTIHNMAYQGIVEGHNWLKEGILHSDALVAVSPTYAQEILTAYGGAGLEAVVQSRRHKLHGILNGIDIALFNPATDAFLPLQYDTGSVKQGKRACKEALQMEMGLPVTSAVPLFGMVSRMVEQKGLDIMLEALPQLQTMPAQFVFLGAGQGDYEIRLKALNTTTSNMRSMIGFHMALGQHIYAGADCFLMPSHFEPCGLSQMIALRYGAVPVVRQTGGLADTVFDIDADENRGNGFVFTGYTAQALVQTLQRAILHWQRHDDQWQTMMERGMTADFSWDSSARAYQAVYEQVCQNQLQRTF